MKKFTKLLVGATILAASTLPVYGALADEASEQPLNIPQIMRDFGRDLIAADLVALRESTSPADLSKATQGIDAAIALAEKAIAPGDCQMTVLPPKFLHTSEFDGYLIQFIELLKEYRQICVQAQSGTPDFIAMKTKSEEIKDLVGAAHDYFARRKN